MGEKHKALEEALTSRLAAENVTLYANGHLALEAVIRALKLPQGGEIITTPFTFASTTNAIVRCGFVPVFCDVRESDLTLDPSLIEEKITDRTVAIMPVHVYGNVCDTDAIDAVAKKHNLSVIYDAAHAFAVTQKGRSSATFGDASIFSFHATKVFNTVEGGAVCYSDSSLRPILEAERNFGIQDDGYICHGGNGKMSEFHAAMGLCNLRYLDDEIAKRRTVFTAYMSRLSGISGIRIPLTGDADEMNFAYFPVLFEGYKYNRDTVIDLLNHENIFPRKYFTPLTSELLGEDVSLTPIAKRATENILTLPMYADLSITDAERICDIILK